MLLSIMGFIGPGPEFVLCPAEGGVDRSERRRSTTDSLIIKPFLSPGKYAVMVVDGFSPHMQK